jgi:hypothetical protein
MRRWIILAWVASAACRAPTPEELDREFARSIREQVEFDQWPKPPGAPMAAGFDILNGIPPEMEAWQLTEDDFDYQSSWQVVTRRIKWRLRGAPLTVICGVGTGSVDQTHRAMLASIASLAPVGEKLKRDPTASIPRVTAADPRVFTAFCRGNVFIVFAQPAPVNLDPAPVLAEWDKKIQEQPPLFRAMEFVPRIQEIKSSRKGNALKKDSRIVFTIKLDGEEGFVPAGIEILENGKRQSYMLHTSALHLGVTANIEGSYTLHLWVANKRQLAAISVQKITVN